MCQCQGNPTSTPTVLSDRFTNSLSDGSCPAGTLQMPEAPGLITAIDNSIPAIKQEVAAQVPNFNPVMPISPNPLVTPTPTTSKTSEFITDSKDFVVKNKWWFLAGAAAVAGSIIYYKETH